MEKNLANEIIAILLKGPLHIRGLADTLQENHMTIRNKLAILSDDNAVDFKTEGKNKIFFLKKTIEARNYAITAEIYRQSRAVKTYPVLRGVIQEVLEIPDIRLSLIFGSYAKGEVHEKSDIDLFVETQNRELKKSLENRRMLLSVKTGAFDTGSPLIREIIADHIIVKGMEEYFEKIRFFG